MAPSGQLGEEGLAKRQRCVIHGDALALLSLGLLVVYVLGIGVYSPLFGVRGWPYWLLRIVPHWFPGPVMVWGGLFPVSIAFCSLGSFLAERQSRARDGSPTAVPRLCVFSGVSLLFVLLSMSVFPLTRWLLVGRHTWALGVYGVCCIPMILFIRRHLRRIRQVRRLRSGCCIECGYNLTGLTEPRCPECGTGFAMPADPSDRIE